MKIAYDNRRESSVVARLVVLVTKGGVTNLTLEGGLCGPQIDLALIALAEAATPRFGGEECRDSLAS